MLMQIRYRTYRSLKLNFVQHMVPHLLSSDFVFSLRFLECISVFPNPFFLSLICIRIQENDTDPDPQHC